MTLEELVARCKAGVHLTVNGHRDVYETPEDYITHADDVTPALLAEFKAGADVYELQFYPETPIGFYREWGTSLADVLAGAASVFQSGADNA